MNTVTETELSVYSTNILEPLCDATHNVFKPIPLLEQDYLYIGVDEECKRFITAVVSARKSDPSDPGEKLFGKDKDFIMQSFRSPSFKASSWMKRIPEKVQDKKNLKVWVMGGTDYTALVIHHVWSNKLIFKTIEAELFYKFLIHRFMCQTKNSHVAANFKVHGTVPKMPSEYVVHPNPNLRLNPYQEVALYCSLNSEAYALFMEQGTGKTPIVVNRVNTEGTMKRLGNITGVKPAMYRVLVLCPKQVLGNWKNEFVRFSVSPGKVAVLRGGLMRKQKCLIDGCRPDKDCIWSACIISLDSVASLEDTIQKVPWDLVVIDESHKIKNPNSKRFKSSKIFQLPSTRARMILTGTPIANTINDLFSQFEFMAEGLSGFMNIKSFKSFHGKYTKPSGGTAVSRLIGLKGVPLIKERLARNSFMIKKKEAGLNLPDKVYDIREVEMTEKQSKIYSTIAADLIVKIDEILEDKEGKITADHILTMMLRLAQITSGHIKTDKEIDPYSGEVINEGIITQIDKDNPKVLDIIDMVLDESRDPNGKMIIWAAFVEDLRVVSEALAEREINHVGYHKVINKKYKVSSTEDAENVINCDKDCRILLANPASGGTGSNYLGYDRNNPDDYETYVDHEVFMSSNWNAVDRAQAEDRAHRRGTRSNVRITDQVIIGTIDEEIRVRIMDKQKTALEIQDVRDILTRLTDRS